MSNPKVVAEMIDGRFVVQLENWTGVANSKIEQLAFAVYKQAQIERANAINAERREQSKPEQLAADAVVDDGKVTQNPPTDDFVKELENALLENQTHPA